MKKIAILFLAFVVAAGSLMAQVKKVDPEFEKFWKDYASASCFTDTDWMEDNSWNMVYQGENGRGEPEIFTKADYISNLDQLYLTDKQAEKKLNQMTKLNLKKALSISKVNESFLDVDFGDGPIYTKLKIKGDDMLYSVLFVKTTYSFIKQGNTFKYIGIYLN